MMHMRLVITLLGMLLIPAMPAGAVVQTFSARATATVQELIDGTVINSDSSFEELNASTPNLPLVADAILTRQGEGEDQVGAAVAVTTFSDPRISTTPDPNEFGISTAGLSLIDGLGYTGGCSAMESRVVNFLTTEIGEPAGTPLKARSFFFLDGVLLIWSEDGRTDLSGAVSRVGLKVMQKRGDGDEGTQLLEAGLDLRGGADGRPLLTADGAVSRDNVILVPVSDLVPGLGLIHLVIIPHLAIPYDYEAAVGEPFTLEAAVTGDIEVAGGTGALAVLGLDRGDLRALITDIVGGDAGQQLADAVDFLLGSRLEPARPLPPSNGKTVVTVRSRGAFDMVLDRALFPWCGLLGLESLMGAALLAFITFAGGVRRR